MASQSSPTPGPSTFYDQNANVHIHYPLNGNLMPATNGNVANGSAAYHSHPGPSYQTYHSIPQQLPYNPSQPQSHPYHQHHPKYQPIYPPYSPSWPANQPLSPLPKQLSMPPPSEEPPITAPSPLSSPPPSPPPQQPSIASLPDPRPVSPGGWAIWSRRPHDPRHAPGIIISPRARPPQNVVRHALSTRTPPASPVLSETPLPPEQNVQTPEKDDIPAQVRSHDISPKVHTPPSSTTETTPACSTAPDTPVPGSPASSATSVSVTGLKPDVPLPPSSPPPALPQPPPPSSTPPPPPPAVAEAATTPATATASGPSPPKKSWASLLRPPASSGTTTSNTTPNNLPTSSVIGFSIPASTSTSQTPALQTLLTSPFPFPTALPVPKIRARGLVNSGNMCFANAVLQALVHCPPFWAFFSQLGRVLGERGSSGEAPLVEATIRFLREFAVNEEGSGKEKVKEGKGKGKGKEKKDRDESEDGWDAMDSFTPTYVYDALKDNKRFDNMRGGHQEDAEEFLGFYLDTLEEELLGLANGSAITKVEVEEKIASAAPPPVEDGWLEVGKRNRAVVTRTIKTTDSPITRIFGGKFRSTLRAPQQKDSVIVEDWRALRLDIQRESIHTITDALSAIAHPSTVHLGARGEASQQILIEALPPILVLHLKRFLYDGTGVVKLGRQVKFGGELEVGGEVVVGGKRGGGGRYRLFGVVYHHGSSAAGGHYTIYVERDGGWMRIDDELVSDVRNEDVFGGWKNERDERCAYLLFYRRVGRA